MNALEIVKRQAAAWGLSLGRERVARLEAYARLLSRYELANVIGTRDMREILSEHILDSLSCGLYRPLLLARSLVDVGSGGGLPGIPLKIAMSGLSTTLVEATAKKAVFLRAAVGEMRLQGVEVANTRVEDLGRAEAHRGAYDIATVRAVARLAVIAEYCVPLLQVGGAVVSMKGRVREDELSEGARAAKLLGATVAEIIDVTRLPEVGHKERCLVVLRKVKETPQQYPRKVGVPAKRPLGMV